MVILDKTENIPPSIAGVVNLSSLIFLGLSALCIRYSLLCPPGLPLEFTGQFETQDWMCCVPHSTKSNHTLGLLEAEGLIDVE
jgi:hypothetical protein